MIFFWRPPLFKEFNFSQFLHSINGQIDMFDLNLYMNTCSPLSEAALLPKSWDYASLLWNLYSLGWRYRDAGPKHCDYSQTSRVSDLSILKPLLNYFAHGATYCWLWLHHPSVVNILLLLPPILPYSSFTSTLFFPLRARELRHGQL